MIALVTIAIIIASVSFILVVTSTVIYAKKSISIHNLFLLCYMCNLTWPYLGRWMGLEVLWHMEFISLQKDSNVVEYVLISCC